MVEPCFAIHMHERSIQGYGVGFLLGERCELALQSVGRRPIVVVPLRHDEISIHHVQRAIAQFAYRRIRIVRHMVVHHLAVRNV